MTGKKKILRAQTLYLARGRSDIRSLSDIMGRLPVTVTIRRGRITRASARFDLTLEGGGGRREKGCRQNQELLPTRPGADGARSGLGPSLLSITRPGCLPAQPSGGAVDATEDVSATGGPPLPCRFLDPGHGAAMPPGTPHPVQAERPGTLHNDKKRHREYHKRRDRKMRLEGEE